MPGLTSNNKYILLLMAPEALNYRPVPCCPLHYMITEQKNNKSFYYKLQLMFCTTFTCIENILISLKHAIAKAPTNTVYMNHFTYQGNQELMQDI